MLSALRRDVQGQAWAFELYALLQAICGLNTARGRSELPADPPKTGPRGRTKKSKARNDQRA